jgi:hypothetical protein
MASTTWKPRQLIYNIKPLRPPPRGVVGEVAIYPLCLEARPQAGITTPTGPDLFLVLFTQNKYLHNNK